MPEGNTPAIDIIQLLQRRGASDPLFRMFAPSPWSFAPTKLQFPQLIAL